MRVHIPRTVLGAVVVLTAASLAQASPHRSHDRDHDRRDGLVALASDVADNARRLHRVAERTAHHPSYREARALARLHDLDLRAREFERALRYDGPYAPNVRRDFRELEHAFFEARGVLPGLHTVPAVEREFARLNAGMRDLNQVYGERLARYDRPRRDGRHGDVHGSVHVDLRWDGGRASVGYRR